ncbi:MAG: hypothetical protein PF518_04395 [Spirochaetaceae bacterium]|jgi:uncharacterized protein YxeA|nr:hypothetical protein [Spirochaetaceae bacterium]
MKKILLNIIIFVLLISCSRQSLNDSDLNYVDYSYLSNSGDSLIISVPDSDVYSYETLKLSLKLKYKKEHSPQMPDWSLLKDALNIIDMKETYGPIVQDDFITRILEITLGPQLPGDYLLNPLTIYFYTNGKVVDEIQTEYIPISIKSSLIGGEEDIIDDFEFIKEKNNILQIIAITIIVLVLMGTIIFFFYKKMKKNDHKLKIEKDYLSLIENINSEDIKEIYLNLSSTLKEFIDNKLYLSVQSQTTEEFIYFSKNLPFVEEWLKIQLYSFLQRSDEARFGLKTPDKERAKGDILFCREFINYVNNKKAQELFL